MRTRQLNTGGLAGASRLSSSGLKAPRPRGRTHFTQLHGLGVTGSCKGAGGWERTLGWSPHREPVCCRARIVGRWAVHPPPLQELMASLLLVFTTNTLSFSRVGDQPAWDSKLTVAINFSVKSLQLGSLNHQDCAPAGSTRGRAGRLVALTAGRDRPLLPVLPPLLLLKPTA